MIIKIFKKSKKPCKYCLAIKRNDTIEVHFYSGFRRYLNAKFGYLDSGYAVYSYHVFKTGSLWYMNAETINQPFDMELTRLTGLVAF